MGRPSLTQRELGVLYLVAEGRGNKDIARRLLIADDTAKTRVKAILTKLDAISRTVSRKESVGSRNGDGQRAERYHVAIRLAVSDPT